MLRRFRLDKINGTKILSFSFRELQLISFTFNLRLLYELKYKARLSETMCEVFHFRFRFAFIATYLYLQQNV